VAEVRVTPIKVADLLAEGERMPVYVQRRELGRVVIAGDLAITFGDLDDPQTEGQRLVRALEPEAVWLAHTNEPWRPSRSQERA
jgi:hypothetical protein